MNPSKKAIFGRGLATKPKTERQVAATTPGYSFEFLRKWGTLGEGDGEFHSLKELAIAGDGNVYVADAWNQPPRIQVFKRVSSNDTVY
jgi:hypothetical protein